MSTRESAFPPVGDASLRDGLWTVPNLLTLARLPLGALIWFDPSNVPFVLAVLAVAGITDILDGRLARAARGTGNRPSGPGVWLDPVCDKIFIVSTVLAVGFLSSAPLILFPLVLARELVLVLAWGGLLLAGGWRTVRLLDLEADFSGKATTVAQFLSIGLLLLYPPLLLPAAAVAGALGVFAGARYFWRSASRLASCSPLSREKAA